MQAISAGLTRVGLKLAARAPAIKRVASPSAVRAERAVLSRTMRSTVVPQAVSYTHLTLPTIYSV